MNLIKSLLLFIIISTTLVGCYKMPPDDYMSTVPITNNPSIIKQKKASATAPQASF